MTPDVDPMLMRRLWRPVSRPGVIDLRFGPSLVERHTGLTTAVPLAERLLRRVPAVDDLGHGDLPLVTVPVPARPAAVEIAPPPVAGLPAAVIQRKAATLAPRTAARPAAAPPGPGVPPVRPAEPAPATAGSLAPDAPLPVAPRAGPPTPGSSPAPLPVYPAPPNALPPIVAPAPPPTATPGAPATRPTAADPQPAATGAPPASPLPASPLAASPLPASPLPASPPALPLAALPLPASPPALPLVSTAPTPAPEVTDSAPPTTRSQPPTELATAPALALGAQPLLIVAAAPRNGGGPPPARTTPGRSGSGGGPGSAAAGLPLVTPATPAGDGANPTRSDPLLTAPSPTSGWASAPPRELVLAPAGGRPPQAAAAVNHAAEPALPHRAATTGAIPTRRPGAQAPPRTPAPPIDVDAIVDTVHRRFLGRLAVEAERRAVRW